MATLKEVYDAFKADGAPMPDTYEAFESFMTSGPNNGYDHRKEWYDAFKADGAPLPDTYEAFSAALFEPSRQPAVIAADNAGDASQADQAQFSSPISLPPTTGDRIRMLHGLNTLMKNGAAARKETVEQTRRVLERNTPKERAKIQSAEMQSRFMGMPTKPLGMRSGLPTPPPESDTDGGNEPAPRSMESPAPYGMVMDADGNPVQQWLLPDGTVTTDFLRADMAETDARGARLAYEFNTRMRRNGLDPTNPKDVVDQKLEDQTRKARASQKVLHAEEAQKSPYSRQKGESVGQYLLRVLFSGQPNTQTAIVGRSVNGYDQALKSSDMRSIEGTLHTLGKVRDLRESQELERGDGFFDWRNIGNFGTGLKQVATDIDTYAGGTLEAQDMLHLVDIKNRTEQGEQLSEADLAFAEAMMLKGTAEGLGSAPHGYTAGRTTGEMGRFMIQMIMNPTSGAGKRLATALVNRAVRKYGAQGAAKWTAKVLGNVTANKVAGHVAGDVLSSAVLANTLQMPTTLSDAIGRNLGNVTVGADGTSVEFSDGESLLKSIAKAEGAATIENFTEKLGDHFGGIGRFFGRGVTKSAEKLGLGNIVAGISSFATRIKSTEWAKAIASMESRAQWNGTLGEILEEESGIVLNSIFTGDNNLSDLTDIEQQIDIVLGVGLFGGVVSGIKTAGYPIGRYRAKKGVDATNAQANALFGNDWVGIKGQIDGADDMAFTATVTSLIRSVGENRQQAEAITRYAQALMKWRGYNLAQQMQNEEPGAQTSMQSHVENSFERGYNTSTPQEMNDARNAWEYQREQVKSVLSDDEIAGLDSNPAGALNEMRATGLYDTAQMDAALDYVNAKATYDGMIQSVRDDIDEKIAMSDAMINGRVNQASGMIQPAVMGLDDRQVYVVGGTLAVNDDGTIDRDASDESIVVRDAETGRLEFTDPKSIVSAGNAIDPEMERAIAIDNIRQQTAQTAVDAMNGTLAFNPGDVVPVNDGGGVVDVTIVGPAVDRESGMPVEGQVTVQFPDGQQTTFAKEQLQGFADAANLERFNAFERERSAARARQRAAAEATRPQFAINDEFTILNENGTPVRGSITDELDEDGTVEIYTEEPVDGKTVNHVTPAELERMLDTYNGKPVAGTVAVPENAETVPNPAENPETGAETGENPTETVPNSDETVTGPQPSVLSRIPVDGQGQRRYEDTDADTAWDAIVEQSAGDEATAAEVVADIVSERRDDLKAAEKVLDKVKEGKPEKRKKGDPAPTMEERIAAKNAAKAALSSAQADYDRAKSVLDHWELVAGTRQRRDDERRRAQEEEQRRLDAIAHDEAVARFEEEQRVKAEKQAEQERIGTHAVNPRIKEKWDGAPKIDGNSDAITLPDGSTLTGRYVLTEAGAASASHDVENAYMPTEGFPVDENGQSVNDRDYMRDKDAQRIVEGMADSYDSRALQDPVIVSNDGVVLSGNNRTMSGDLAAGRGTDRAYVDYLAQFGHRKYGFTPEQVTGLKNPRVVFVPDEALPYDAATFARFNAQEKKSQGKPEAAVKLGKIVPDNVFGDIVGAISRYDRLSDYYADEKAVAHALGALMQAGVINDRQMPEMRTGTALSAAGKELIENTLIGKVFQTSPDAVRQLISVPALRQSVVMGLNEIANNRTLAPNGYDISGELARAVDLVTQARSAMPDVYTTGVPVSPFGRMQGLFDDEFGDSRVTDGTVLLLADILNSGKPSDLRKVLTAYNNEASQSAGGQLDMFSGTIPTKEEILTTVNDHFRNATPKEQRALVDAAIAERKRRATADTQQRGRLQTSEQTPHDDERRAEPRQSATERAERGGVLPVAERGRQGNVSNPQRRQQDNLAEREIDENGHPFVVANDGTTSFGIIREDSGLPSAPIKLSVGYQDENGKGYGLRHIESGHGKEIRNAGFSTVEEFVSYVAKNYDEDNIRVGKQRDNGSTTYLIQVTDSHDNTLFIELSRDGSYWNVNSGGVFRKGYSNKKETVAKTEPQQPNNAVSSDSSLSTDEQSGTSSIEPNGEPTVSDRKVNDSASEKQGVAAESSLNARVKAAEAEVNTAPTPGQKEAGNYKKGHVQIGTFDVTIEQPVGSVRRGIDANGKEWATTMQNTYGYIRGTEGVDGDHIDVFLSTDIDAWNGRRVVIVDQYNPDGSFDEHKVMLGFNDKSDAVSAYLANYEKGWEKGRRLVFSTAALEDFEKWIESSKRKQKPYHEYKIAGKAEVDESTPGDSVSADDQPLSLDDMRQLTAEATAAKAAEREQPQSTDKVVNPSGNKLVTDERYAELRERMRKKLGGQLNMGVDPEILAIGAEMAVYHIEKGARKFKAYALAMIADLGDAIRPYLKAFYNAVRDMPEAVAAVVVAKDENVNRMGDGYGAYSDAEVSYTNDPVSKALGKNRFSRKRQAEFAAQERARMVKRVEELASKLHLDKSRLEIVTDVSQLEGNRAKAKGFYNKHTGKITIVIPNNVSTIDVEQTLLHEAVAHYGLRKLFGKQFDTFLDNVYESADESIRRKIAKMAAQNGWNFRTATEEYLAGLAEDTDFAEAKSYGGWWTKIKSLFLDMLESIGFEGFRDKTGVVLTDNELRYILWRSYENLAEPGLYRSILGEAADVAKQAELKVGNYAEKGIEAEYAAEPNNIDEVNDRFNRELQQQIDGSLPEGHVYEMGMPSKYLRSTGIENLPIRLSAKVLNIKSNLDRHKYSLATVKNLVKAIQQPWAIFAYGEKNKAQNLIIGIEDNGRQFLVGLSINPTVKGRSLEINSIRNVFPKNNHEWVNWINEGKLLRVDGKKEIQAVIAKLRMNPVAFDYLDLDNAAKIVENFENPTIEEEDLFRPGDFTPRDRVTARDTYNRICASRGYQFQEAVQDSMLGLKELYRAILGRKTRIEDVAGFENAYLFENRMSSMNAGEQHEYYLRYMKPLLKEIGRIASANQRKRKELTDYLMAKHGLERNEYMRKEASANGENTDRDFAGLIGLTGEPDWQSAEATARQWVDDYEKMVDTTQLWQAVNNATKASLEKVYLSGIISKETYEKILGMYQYYIPLRGWDETTSEQVYGYLMSKDGPLGGSIMKKAHGRKSMADDPIATIGMMADDAIRQGNRNLMKQRFLNFVLNHPSDAVSIHDIWLEYDDVNDEWRPVFADVKDTDTAEEVEQKVEAFEQRMETLRTADPDKYKKGREAQHIPYKVVRGNLKEHQVLIKRNGRTFVATLNGNPRAAQALNGLTNPDVDQNGVVGNMLKAGTWVNRQLSAFYTTRNPDFVVGNFFRDMLYSNCMTWVKESPRYALRFHKNFARFNPIAMRRLLGKWENGTLDMSKPAENMFYQFMKNGGETGYTNIRDIEGHKRAVAAELKKISRNAIGRKTWGWLAEQMDLLNRSAENCARFAAFVTSREFGRKIDRAVYDAKEVSVNFNKKGSGGKMVNANGQTTLGKAGAYLGGGGRLMYVFWNAGIQGMANVGRQAKLHPGKFMAGASAMFTLGYVIPMLAEMAGGGDGDDDDKNAYYNLPEYVRRSNICFRAGGQWITIPLPIEYRAIYGMGELAHGVISGNERYSNAELGYQMAAQVSQILPLDMLEGGGGVSPFIPSLAKPFTEAYIMNKRWTGLPVYKDTPFNKNDPEWTKAYASTDKHLVSFAKWLNETSGGDDFTKGAIDINPAKIEYLLNGTFGGVVSFPNKVKKSIETAAGNREFEWRNMPVANRLIKSGDERTANRKLQNEYFKYKEEYEETGRRWRKYTNADSNGVLGYAEKIDFLENSPEFLRHEIFDEFRADINANQNMLAQETDKQKRTELEKETFALKRQLVDALHDPAEYFRQLYESGQLSDEYIKYLEKNHGIKLENAKQE